MRACTARRRECLLAGCCEDALLRACEAAAQQRRACRGSHAHVRADESSCERASCHRARRRRRAAALRHARATGAAPPAQPPHAAAAWCECGARAVSLCSRLQSCARRGRAQKHQLPLWRRASVKRRRAELRASSAAARARSMPSERSVEARAGAGRARRLASALAARMKSAAWGAPAPAPLATDCPAFRAWIATPAAGTPASCAGRRARCPLAQAACGRPAHPPGACLLSCCTTARPRATPAARVGEAWSRPQALTYSTGRGGARARAQAVGRRSRVRAHNPVPI